LPSAHRLARHLAESKAAAVADGIPDALVIGADTIVVAEEAILEKPDDPDDAARMLRLLSGRRHHVVTGVALIRRQPPVSLVDSSETAVWFRALTEREIADYVATGEPLDKAGAYGIQGRAGAFVERIEGDYFTVVGLPLARLAMLLSEAGIGYNR
jgi:septum formation protein